MTKEGKSDIIDTMQNGDLIYDSAEKRLGMIVDTHNYIFQSSGKRYKIFWFNESQPYWEWDDYIANYRVDFLEYLRHNEQKSEETIRKK